MTDHLHHEVASGWSCCGGPFEPLLHRDGRLTRHAAGCWLAHPETARAMALQRPTTTEEKPMPSNPNHSVRAWLSLFADGVRGVWGLVRDWGTRFGGRQ